jgi:translocation and assembly module TamA
VRRATLACVLVVTGCVHAPPTPESQEIDSVTIEGTKAISEGDLKKKIVTTESSWLPAWVPVFGHIEWFDPSAWQADLRRLTRSYEANGYYQARVLEEVVSPSKPGHVKVLVKVHEGLPARVTKLTITGLEQVPAEVLAKVMADPPVVVGEIFLEERWQTMKGLLLQRLREAGFAEAVIEGDAEVDVEAAKVDATLTVQTGRRYRFGKIFVATDPGAAVPAKLIADVASGAVTEGAYFSDTAMQEAQARLLQMGVFGAVKVNRGAPDAEEGTVPVVVDIKEAAFRSLRAGGGFGFDLIRNEVRGTVEYTDRNLGLSRRFLADARLDRLTLKGRLGWAFLPTFINVLQGDPTSKNGPIGRLTTEYEVPRLGGIRTLSFQGSLDLSRALDSAFDYLGGELKVGVIWRPRSDISIFPSLNFDTYLLNTQASVRDNIPIAALGCPLGAPCLISFLDVTAELDRRDNKLEPHDGYYLGLSVQGGLSATNGLKPYFRVVPEARGYVSFGRQKRVTLAGKLRVGTLISDADTPIVARFFSGGSNMRGFNQRRLSPQIAVPRTVNIDDPRCPPRTAATQPAGCPRTVQVQVYDDGETLPVGGNSLIEASLELRWNVWGDLVVALFSDWGLVSSAPLGAKTDFANSLYAAVGVGLRYRTVLGPIRLDLGFRLPFIGGPLEVQLNGAREFRSNPGCFFGTFAPATQPMGTPLKYGGSPDSLCNFHLSIGEAF